MVWPEDDALWWAWAEGAVWRGQGAALWAVGAALWAEGADVWRGQGAALWAEGAAVCMGQVRAAPVGDAGGEVTSSRAELQRPAHPCGGRVYLGSDPHPEGHHQPWEQPQNRPLEGTRGGGDKLCLFLNKSILFYILL